MDSHADTCVAGPNFRVDEFTGEHCDVAPYSGGYEPIKDVPIVNASTACTYEISGETLILRFNQVLWYGKRLSMSLINLQNPNQLRHFGLTVSDDPTDKNREFGIVGDDFNIPFEISCTTVYFKSRVPTRWEMENCRIVELTVDAPWNPAKVTIATTNVTQNADTLEERTYRIVCAVNHLPRSNIICNCQSHNDACACASHLSVFDPTHMIRRMIL